MFSKVLIANRGEIAVRVIRACRELGVQTVAVYSEADRGALHVRLADQAVCCGPARAQDSYLAIPSLVEAARATGAEAVHPGYGFLSENGGFADACRDAGVTFIGPPGEVLRQMGDKVTSRRIMSAAGVPVVPGSEDALGDAEAVAFAKEIGLPVMVKASGGGGGRGLRVVHREEDLAAAVERARSEASASFGDDRVYVEKAIESPRHIEVQVLADAHGNAVHLFERECSIQRRHQKLLEEAPACGVDEALRARLGETALRAARAVDYVGAGTVELLMDAKGDFYFLEMNTRVQVEHPITEEITRVDIVQEMIRIAAGERLSLRQDDLRIAGHAIEARVYAEDPAKGFLPSPGRLDVFRPPSGPGIRVDAGVQAGDEVTPHYDAMLAKVVAWGTTREQATRRLDRALSEFGVSGIQTSIPFHRAALRDPRFLAGRYDTSFVEGTSLTPAPPTREALALAVAALALHLETEELEVRVKGKGSPDGPVRVRASGTLPRLGLEVVVGDEAPAHLALEAGRRGDGALSLVDGDHAQWEAFVSRKKGSRFAVRLLSSADVVDFLLDAELSAEPRA